MFPLENEYKSLLPQNAQGIPNFDKAVCTKWHLFQFIFLSVALLFTRAHSQQFRRETHKKLKNWIWEDEIKKKSFSGWPIKILSWGNVFGSVGWQQTEFVFIVGLTAKITFAPRISMSLGEIVGPKRRVASITVYTASKHYHFSENWSTHCNRKLWYEFCLNVHVFQYW